MAMQGTLNAVERSMRSVFVGNIAYDATEEQLKDIFSEVGPVSSFKLFCDDSGKPNGFGFCEYKDPAVARSAMRNLSGFEFKGRALSVDIAASVKSKGELENLHGNENESQIEDTDSKTEKAPEEISKAVASLPAEQMFELMKQMKMCIENNPIEARNLLLQNPQLAYALLQAQVIMRIVDPGVAMKILNRPTAMPVPSGATATPENKPAMEPMQVNPPVNEGPPMFQTAEPNVMPPMSMGGPDPRLASMPQSRSSFPGDRLPIMAGPGPLGMPGSYDQDLRTMGDQDLRQLPILERDTHPPPILGGDKDMRQHIPDQDMRSLAALGGLPDNRPFDPRFRGSDMNRAPLGMDKARPVNVDPRTVYENRMNPAPVRVEDPRKAAMANPRVPPAASAAPVPVPAVQRQAPTMISGVSASAPQDQEKAALIMQVLQLSDQQIAMLPPEQRQSILVLKEQIARSQLS